MALMTVSTTPLNFRSGGQVTLPELPTEVVRLTVSKVKSGRHVMSFLKEIKWFNDDDGDDNDDDGVDDDEA